MSCLLLPLGLMAVVAFIISCGYAYSAHAEAKRLVSDLKSLRKQYDGLLTLCAKERVRRRHALWEVQWEKTCRNYMVQGVVTPALDRWHKNWMQDHMYDNVVWFRKVPFVCAIGPEGQRVMYVDRAWDDD